MSLPEVFIIAVGLSMDAFAVSACAGLGMPKATLKKALIVGLYFGAFQAFMPLAGLLLAGFFAESIIAFDHWIAFFLLCFIGGRMVAGSFGKEPQSSTETSLKPSKMLPLAVATSIDALAVGVGFAFLQADVVPVVSLIGVTTLVLSMAGVIIGNVFGTKFKSKAELAGGAILILMGFKILFEHLGFVG